MRGMLWFLYLPHWFWHPLDEGTGSTCSAINHTGCGYAGWSGAFSDIGEISTLGIFVAMVSLLIGLYRKHNCHVAGCPWLSWHTSDEHGGHPVCKGHHPHGGNVTAAGVNRTVD